MEFSVKKKILSIISLLNVFGFTVNLVYDLLNVGNISLILADFIGIILTIIPFVIINFKKNIKHLYYTTIFFAITGFLSINICCFVFSSLGIIFSLIKSEQEKDKLSSILKKHPVLSVMTIILVALTFLNSGSLLEYFSSLAYGFNMLGELMATLFLLFLLIICKKTHLLYKSKGSIKESIMVSLPFIVYILYIGTGLFSIYLAEGYHLLSIDNIIVIILLYLLVGMFEEFLLRGLSLNILIDKFGNNKKGIWLSIFISSILFGLIHFSNLFTGASLSGVTVQVISSIFIGFYFSAIYLRSGSVWTTAILHGLYDLVVSIPELFYTHEIVDTAADYAQSISNYNWINILFNSIFIVLTLILLRKNKLKDVIAMRKGKKIVDSDERSTRKIMTIGLCLGATIYFCYSVFMTMFNIRDLTLEAYNKILSKNDYQRKYGLTYKNGLYDYENLDDETKILLAISNLKQNDFVDLYSINDAENDFLKRDIFTYITKEKIDESLKDIFGTNKNIKYVTVDVSNKTNCSYEEKNKKYTCVTTDNAVDNGLKVYVGINSINLEDIENIELSVYYLVEDINTSTIYADADLKTVFKYDTTMRDLVGNIKYDENDLYNYQFFNAIKEKNDDIPTYRITFKIDEMFDKVYFDSSEFVDDKDKKALKVEKIDNDYNKYNSNKCTFNYNKKYFTIDELNNSISLNYNSNTYLKIENIGSELWLSKYKNSNGNNVIFGNNNYYHYGDEYLIYKNGFYLITIPLNNNKILNNSVNEIMQTLEFKNDSKNE